MRWRFLDWTARPFHAAAQFQFEPRTLWIGATWDLHRWQATITGSDNKHGPYIARPWSLHVYACLLPTLPLHVYIERTVRPVASSEGGEPPNA